MASQEQTPPEIMQAVQRCFAIIRVFGQEQRLLTQAQVAGACGLSRATVRRFLLSLEALGYVRREEGLYSLQPRILDLGYSYLSSMTLWDVARTHMEDLVSKVRESSSAAVMDGTDIIFTVRVPTQRIMSVQVEMGTRFPAHATSMGRVMLAHVAPEVLDEYFRKIVPERLTPRTVTDEEGLRAILKEVAAAGWCLLDEELEVGVRSLAVPLHDADGRVIAAMNVCAHASRVSASRMRQEFLPLLLRAAEAADADTRTHSSSQPLPRPVALFL